MIRIQSPMSILNKAPQCSLTGLGSTPKRDGFRIWGLWNREIPNSKP